MDLFTLVARLGMDSSEYERGITQARGSFEKLGGFIGAKAVAFGTMAAHAIERAAGAAVNFGKSAIQAAADLESERALFKQVFGTMQGEAEKSFDAVGKSTGILASRLKNVGTKAFMQFKGAGLDGVDALTMMEEYTSLAADAAAAYNISLEDADERLRSFLRGNTEAGDAIGLFTTESQRNTAALEKYGKKWKDLNEAQRQMLMLNISHDIYEQGEVLGQAGRESEQFNVKLDNLRKAWEKAQGILGDPIMAVITPYIQDVADFLADPEVETALTRFGLTVGNAIKATVDFVLGIPSPNEIAYQLNRWWDDVKAQLNPMSVTATYKIQKIEETIKKQGVVSAIKEAVDDAWWNPSNWGTTTKTSSSGVVYESTHGGYGAGFAVGLDYVPYDDFRARLHEGEAVLTKREAEEWRNGGIGQSIDYDRLAQAVGISVENAVANALDGSFVDMDKEHVGRLVVPTVSRVMAQEVRGRRYYR